MRLDRLVEEYRDAGLPVWLQDGPSAACEVPALIGRTAYRVVQEGLTNASRHAPGAAATVRVAGERGDKLVVEVRNGPPPGPDAPAAMPGSGLGLVGLRERVALAGGCSNRGPSPTAGFGCWPGSPGQTARERRRDRCR